MQQYSQLSLIYSRNTDKVYSANSRSDNHKYIVKWIKSTEVDANRLAKEAEIHQKLKHENIVYLKNHFHHIERGIKYLVLVFEYCSGGSLDNVIGNNQLDLVDRFSWLMDISTGLNYLHSNNIIHRDIKPENILLSRGKAKIGDLGISKYLGDKSEEDTKKIGTLWYNSPEIFEGGQHGFQTDIWSFGIVLLEIVLNQRINALIGGQAPPAKRKDFPEKTLVETVSSTSLKKLIKRMLSLEKSKRPTIGEVIEKLAKIQKKMVRSCNFEQISIELPLQMPSVGSGESREEWLHRIDPSKEGEKPKFFTLKTATGGKDVRVRYDDYKQSLKITYEKMEVAYEYKHLPLKLKRCFRNLGELNNLLKLRNNKIEFQTNGNLTFMYRQRSIFNASNLEQSLNQSQLSSKKPQDPEEEPFHELPNKGISRNKYQQTNPILQTEEKSSENSYQFGQKLSSEARSRNNREEKKAEKFIQKPQKPPLLNSSLQQLQPLEVTQQRPPEARKEEPKVEPQAVQMLGIMLKKKPESPKPLEEQIVEPTQAQAGPIQQFPPEQKGPSLSLPPRQPQPQMSHHPQANQIILDLQKQIQVLELVDGPERIVLPDNYVRLAQEYLKIKELKASEDMLRISIQKYSELRLRYSDKCAHALYQLGKIYLEYSKDDEPQNQAAEEQDASSDFLEKPLSINKTLALELFEDSINTLYYLKSYDFKAFSKANNKIGELYLQSNQLMFAQGFFENALKQTKDFGGLQKRYALKPTLNLGKVYNRMGSHEEALPYLFQAMEIINKYQQFMKHIEAVLDELFNAYRLMRNFGKALEYLQQMGAKSKQGGSKGLLFKRAEKLAAMLADKPEKANKPHLSKLLKIYQDYMPEQTAKIMALRSKIQQL